MRKREIPKERHFWDAFFTFNGKFQTNKERKCCVFGNRLISSSKSCFLAKIFLLINFLITDYAWWMILLKSLDLIKWHSTLKILIMCEWINALYAHRTVPGLGPSNRESPMSRPGRKVDQGIINSILPGNALVIQIVLYWWQLYLSRESNLALIVPIKTSQAIKCGSLFPLLVRWLELDYSHSRRAEDGWLDEIRSPLNATQVLWCMWNESLSKNTASLKNNATQSSRTCSQDHVSGKHPRQLFGVHKLLCILNNWEKSMNLGNQVETFEGEFERVL